ncbi:MAG: hypothetical protein IJH42_02965, partial [Atopobiaceae bacterium]|nr:hypothetical protein [Atopobiaceae bacterium]
VETLFDVFAASGKTTFHKIGESWQTTVPAMLERMGRIPPEQREAFGKIVWALVRELVTDQHLKGTAQPKISDLLAGTQLGDWLAQV